MTRTKYIIAALLLLTAGFVYAATIGPGTIQLTRYENGQPIRWTTSGTSALIHGDDADLFITWDKAGRRWVCIVQADEAAAATTGYIPDLRLGFGGAANEVYLYARKLN